MTHDTSKVKETIRRLLNVAANDASTDGEVENALRFARQMMATYHLTEDEIEQHKQQAESKSTPDFHEQAAFEEILEQQVYSHAATLKNWEGDLCMFVQKFIGSVKIYYTSHETVRTKHNTIKFDKKGKPKKACSIKFVGLPDEIEIATELYDNLSILISGMARIRFGHFLKGEGQAYAEGFVSGLFTKLHEADKYLSSNAQSTALIVKSNEIALRKQNLASRWLTEKKNVKLSDGKRTQTKNYDHAKYQGYQDGKDTDINNLKQTRAPRIN